MGKPKNLTKTSKPLDPAELEFITASLAKIQGMNLLHGQGPQVCWLANYATQQDLGLIFEETEGRSFGIYGKMQWAELRKVPWHRK